MESLTLWVSWLVKPEWWFIVKLVKKYSFFFSLKYHLLSQDNVSAYLLYRVTYVTAFN